MPYLVTLKDGLMDVVLPTGDRYQGGDTAILSDRQYGLMPDSTRTAVLASAQEVESS